MIEQFHKADVYVQHSENVKPLETCLDKDTENPGQLGLGVRVRRVRIRVRIHIRNEPGIGQLGQWGPILPHTSNILHLHGDDSRLFGAILQPKSESSP